MSQFPTPIRLAQAVGLTGAAYLAGTSHNPQAQPPAAPAASPVKLPISPRDSDSQTNTTCNMTGNIAAYSFATIPALQNSQNKHNAPASLLAKQWSELYARGRAQNPPIAAVTAAAFAYLAWSVHSGKSAALEILAPKNAAYLYSAAAALTLGIVPWTMYAMTETNDALHERAKEAFAVTEKTGDEVRELLSRWKVLNAIRGVLPLVGGLVGFLAF